MKLLSLYLYSAGKHEEACELILSTLERFPGDVELIENSGIILRILKKPLDAIKQLLEAHRLAPEKANVCDALAHTFSGIGDAPNADRFGRLSLELKDRQSCQKPPVVMVPGTSPEPFQENGAKKNVISFSLWGENPRYLRGAIRNVTAAFDIYPGWICRFYCDDSVPREILGLLRKRGAEVVMRKRPASFYEGLLWRFEVINDDSVDRFLVRDCDSVVNVKERVAVDEWIASGKWFHLMRDYASHTELILAGMWGGVSGILPPLDELLVKFESSVAPTRTYDQLFLRDAVWPVVKQSVLCHDSIYMGTLGSVPFPSLGHLPDSVHVGQNEAAVREKVIVDLPGMESSGEVSLVILTGADRESVGFVGEALTQSGQMRKLNEGSLESLLETLRTTSNEFFGSDGGSSREGLVSQMRTMVRAVCSGGAKEKPKRVVLVDDTEDYAFLTELAESMGAKLLIVVRDPRDVASSRRISAEEEAIRWADQWSNSIGDTARASRSCPEAVELVRYEDFSSAKLDSTLRRLESFLGMARDSFEGRMDPVDTEKPLPDTIARVIEHHAAPRMKRLRYLKSEKVS
ncbi:MAG: hypothetical protein AAF491_04740 [Verrucomicrobiota bacterium]